MTLFILKILLQRLYRNYLTYKSVILRKGIMISNKINRLAYVKHLGELISLFDEEGV